MKCPCCDSVYLIVLETRTVDNTIRRTRRCRDCRHRFRTAEIVIDERGQRPQVPVFMAHELRQQGKSWKEVAREINRQQHSNFQGSGIGAAVRRWEKQNAPSGEGSVEAFHKP